MNIHRFSSEQVVLIWAFFQCVLDLIAVNFGHASTLVHSTSHTEDHVAQTEFNDNVDLGITNIVSIMESINSATNDHLVNKVLDDRMVYRSTSLSQLRPLNDPEYQKFGCGFHCGLRPAHSTIELKRVQSVLSDTAHDFPVVIDCVPVNESSPYSAHSSVRIECITHYTGHLIHVIVTYDNSSQGNDSMHTPVILGDRFGEHIQTLFQAYASRDRGDSITSLYVTLDLPLRSLDAADLIPFSSSLKHLSINSHSLQIIDQLLLKDLHLDYFILEGCHRLQERVSRPQETRISPLSDRAHRLNCVVVWSYTCPNCADFEMLADTKTQNRLCNSVQPQVRWQPVDTIHDRVSPGEIVRRRARRSPPSVKTSKPIDFTHRLNSPGDPLPFFIEKLIQRFEDELKNFGKDVRRDISWYQTMMNLFIGILAFILLILGATLIAFWIFLRQVFRGKVKPIRATM